MKARIIRKLGMALFMLAVAFIAQTAMSSSAYAQGPCPVNPYHPNPYIRSISNTILSLQAQGADVTCDNTNLYVQFPDGNYFSITIPEDAAVRMFSFDPVTGRVTYFYILGGIDDEPMLIIHDSVLGTINANDGWFSVFYPMGNPFSAAIKIPWTL